MLVCQFLFCAEARKEVIKFYIVYAVGRETMARPLLTVIKKTGLKIHEA